jgi:hypothetical protein
VGALVSDYDDLSVGSTSSNGVVRKERSVASTARNFEAPRALDSEIARPTTPSTVLAQQSGSGRAEDVNSVAQSVQESVVAKRHTQPMRIDVEQILRMHYTNKILRDLTDIQDHCGSAASAVYAYRLLETMRQMQDVTPSDPYLQIVSALHDALAYEHRWTTYDAQQYAAAHDVLKECAFTSNFTDKHLGKALMKLEAIGFDTLPIPIDMEEDEV